MKKIHAFFFLIHPSDLPLSSQYQRTIGLGCGLHTRCRQGRACLGLSRCLRQLVGSPNQLADRVWFRVDEEDGWTNDASDSLSVFWVATQRGVMLRDEDEEATVDVCWNNAVIERENSCMGLATDQQLTVVGL
jgi:hypothetical protein